jgi:hypothetical protein
MNVIFLTLDRFLNINDREISEDLMRKFRKEGHSVYVVVPRERRFDLPTKLEVQGGVNILGVKTLNIQKTNFIEKGISTMMIEKQYICAINKYLKDISFDLILYTTPPITFTGVVDYLKKKNPQAISYLLLKDIFPQNAVDIEMFGEKSIFNWYFRRKEIKLYRQSDYIGCMSPANVKFLLAHNDFISSDNVEVAPNSIELAEQRVLSDDEKFKLKTKYNLPTDKPILIYGGNLGRPQGIDYLIKCLDTNKNRKDCHFLIVGSGTEFQKIKNWYEAATPESVSVFERLPKADYDLLVQSCDVGLIFLDYRFTIPNYPSRLLSYLEYKMPVICATDVNTDIGKIAEENGYGYWCESVKPEDFTVLVDKILKSNRDVMGENGYQYLKENYLVDNTYNVIMGHV